MKQQGKSILGNMDSLVDIVSNNLGVLVILATFMALFGMVHIADAPPQRELEPERPEQLLVPWSHSSHKNPLLFALHEERIVHLDLLPLFKELPQRPRGVANEPLEFTQKGLRIRFFPVTNQVYCMEFLPRPGAGERWPQAQQAGSAWQALKARYDPRKFYYFFWVSGDSFKLFRQLRKALWEEQYEVGWKPSLPDAPLELCNGFQGATGFQPQ